MFNTHHGLANAIMLAYGIGFNDSIVKERYDYPEKIVGVKDPRQ